LLDLVARICSDRQHDVNEERVHKLKAMGQRFFKLFTRASQGILSSSIYLKHAYNTEDRTSLLREIATTMYAPMDTTRPYEYIIVYEYPYTTTKKPLQNVHGDCHGNNCDKSSNVRVDNKEHRVSRFEYATAFPEHDATSNSTDNENNAPIHQRWLPCGPEDVEQPQEWELAKLRLREIE
jgi:hypothetical protein